MKASLIQTPASREVKMVFLELFADSKGAQNRIRIMMYVKNMPSNANQIANALELDYKAVRFHLNILEKNNVIRKTDASYNAVYYVAPLFEINEQLFWELARVSLICPSL